MFGPVVFATVVPDEDGQRSADDEGQVTVPSPSQKVILSSLIPLQCLSLCSVYYSHYDSYLHYPRAMNLT